MLTCSIDGGEADGADGDRKERGGDNDLGLTCTLGTRVGLGNVAEEYRPRLSETLVVAE